MKFFLKNKANKICYFKDNGINIIDKRDIANKFNNYFIFYKYRSNYCTRDST